MVRNDEAAERGDAPRLALSPEEAAHSLGVSRWRIYYAIKNGEITAYRDRKRTLIPLVELARWMYALPTRGRVPDSALTMEAAQ
jgi:excisionase family DNA binding protein